MARAPIRAQRTIDRAALAGIAVTFVSASLLLALDPVQVVRRAAPVAPLPAPAPAASPRVAADSPLRRPSLPSQAWSVVSDGRSVAYVRATDDERSEIVVRSLRSDDRARAGGGSEADADARASAGTRSVPDWRVAYRAPEGSYVGQLAFAADALLFEEVATGPGGPEEITLRLLRVSSGARTVLDRYVPLDFSAGEGGGFTSALPQLDGRRAAWARQVAERGAVTNELRVVDLETGASAVVFRRAKLVTALALWRDRLAFSLLGTDGRSSSHLLDLGSGTARELDGFASSFVHSIGPRGVVVTGAESRDEPAAAWLVGYGGGRTRLGAQCSAYLFTERVFASRCGDRIEVKDLASGGALIEVAPDAGTLAVTVDGVLWSEGSELVWYELPAEAAR